MFSTILVLFVVSLVGIIALFIVRWYEMRTSIRMFAHIRDQADDKALSLKSDIRVLQEHLKYITPITIAAMRVLTHRAALSIAASARMTERAAHALADRISHKHTFEQRETQSTFLKQVTSHKNAKNTDISVVSSQDANPSI